MMMEDILTNLVVELGFKVIKHPKYHHSNGHHRNLIFISARKSFDDGRTQRLNIIGNDDSPQVNIWDGNSSNSGFLGQIDFKNPDSIDNFKLLISSGVMR